MIPAEKKQGQQQPRPDVEVGDHLYVSHRGSHCAGHVVAHGQHGVTINIDGAHQKVPWGGVLGHKKRAAKRYNIVDQGEDGMLVEDAKGRRRFIAMGSDVKENQMIAKSMRPVLFLKSANVGDPSSRGLSKKQVTDKNGVQTTKWVRNEQGSAPAKPGQHVGFENGEHKGHGEVVASGQHGVTIKDGAGGEHRVLHERVTHQWQGDGAPDGSPHEEKPTEPAKSEVKAHEGDPDSFNAKQFSDLHNDKSATAESIVSGFGGDAADRIEKARQRLGTVKQTVEEHADDKGVWNEKRAELHRKIIFDGVEVNGKMVPGLLAPERIKAAAPPPGERPTFIALGGRGGSGKSSLNGKVYEEGRAIVLDADHIKGLLPEYEGWNAHQVHEESSHVLESVLAMAQILGVNVVLDATMKTGKSIEGKVDDFKKAGFRIEAHYMHLPRQEAAKRAVKRYLDGGEKGRFVPPEVVLGNTNNEENFDKIKSKADAWSFHDNSGGKDAGPKLIAQKGEPATVAKKLLTKSEQAPILILWSQKRGSK